MGELDRQAIGTCERCGKRSYTDRRWARAAIRLMYDPGLRAYRCPTSDMWHVGHLPPAVKAGRATADEVYGDAP